VLSPRPTADKYALDSDDATDLAKIRERHHHFQQSLKVVDVRFEYARALARQMPNHKLEGRKAFKQILATIEAVAFLHQFHRDRDREDRLLATLDDYELARLLLLVPINEALGTSARASADYDRLQDACPKPEITFTSTEAVKKKCCQHKMAFSRMAEKLKEVGVIKLVSPAFSTRACTCAEGSALKQIVTD